jgi:hypothetical protein
MSERLYEAGIKTTPILGNLKTTGEEYAASDHVWILAEIAGRHVALDRGVLCLDRQHYEGYLINQHQLLEFVVQDLKSTGNKTGNPANN